jgi:23S rRNA pseudouridine2605 synthase
VERLNKLLAHAGVGSRRHCDELIAAGRVRVDGQVVRALGIRVDPEKQAVTVDDKPIKIEPLVYWAVNKPRGYLCTNEDPAGRPKAIDLLDHVPQRVYCVGRLDEASEGLLLMTNDGDLAFKLMHPRFGVEKTYQVQVAGHPNHEDMQRLLEGVWLSDGRARARRVRKLYKQGASTWLEIVLSEGKNREVRRMLARLGHKVMRLRRVAIGPIQLDRLKPGKSRRLSQAERVALQYAATELQRQRKAEKKKAVPAGAAPLARERRADAAPLATPASPQS